MPAWITSELRELVCVPIASSASRITTSRPAWASARATARPTTPPPTTTASSFSTQQEPFQGKRGGTRERGDGGHRSRAAVEGRAQQAAHDRAGGEADGADERRRRARGRRERRKRRSRGVGHDQRRTEEKHEERHHHGEPVCHAEPGKDR